MPAVLSLAGPSIDGRTGTQCEMLRAPLNIDDERLVVVGRLFHCTKIDSLYLLSEDNLDEALRLISTKRECMGRAVAYGWTLKPQHTPPTALSATYELSPLDKQQSRDSYSTGCRMADIMSQEGGSAALPYSLAYEYFFTNTSSGRPFRVDLIYEDSFRLVDTFAGKLISSRKPRSCKRIFDLTEGRLGERYSCEQPLPLPSLVYGLYRQTLP